MKSTQQERGSDQIIQQLLQKPQLVAPHIGCSSGQDKATFLCTNKKCSKPALHCQTCKQCQFHLQNQCSSIRLKLLAFMVNKQNEGKNNLVRKMIQMETEMIQRLNQSRQHFLKLSGLTYLNDSQIKILESIFNKAGSKADIFGKNVATIVQKIEKVKEQFVDRQYEMLDIYQTKIERITQTLLELQKNIVGIYLRGTCQLDSKIVFSDALSEREFIIQSLKFPKRPKYIELIFRASQNRFLADKFHEKCDGINNTLTIVKTQLGKIIAGYTPLQWSSPTYPTKEQSLKDQKYIIKKSFLLSVSNRQKLSLQTNNQSISIVNKTGSGPIFGTRDLVIGDKCNNQLNSNLTKFPGSYSLDYDIEGEQFYEYFTGSSNQKFRIVEYQVFSVIW